VLVGPRRDEQRQRGAELADRALPQPVGVRRVTRDENAGSQAVRPSSSATPCARAVRISARIAVTHSVTSIDTMDLYTTQHDSHSASTRSGSASTAIRMPVQNGPIHRPRSADAGHGPSKKGDDKHDRTEVAGSATTRLSRR
jgi:hypothetical protein